MIKIKEYCNMKYLVVCGEIFGGSYPDLKCFPCRIQKEIYYCNEVEFMAFDIKVITDTDVYFEGYDKRAKLFDNAKIPYLKPLVRGELQKCLDYSIDFNSTIPSVLNMPPLKTRNLTEGIVVVHVGRFYCNKEADRSIVKIKNKKFGEVHTQQNAHIGKKRTKIIKNKLGLKDWKKRMNIIKKVMETVLPYITKNRYNNIVSHEWKTGKEIKKPYVNDVLKDYSQDHHETWTILDDISKGIIRKKVEREFLTKLLQWSKV